MDAAIASVQEPASYEAAPPVTELALAFLQLEIHDLLGSESMGLV